MQNGTPMRRSLLSTRSHPGIRYWSDCANSSNETFIRSTSAGSASAFSVSSFLTISLDAAISHPFSVRLPTVTGLVSVARARPWDNHQVGGRIDLCGWSGPLHLVAKTRIWRFRHMSNQEIAEAEARLAQL